MSTILKLNEGDNVAMQLSLATTPPQEVVFGSGMFDVRVPLKNCSVRGEGIGKTLLKNWVIMPDPDNAHPVWNWNSGAMIQPGDNCWIEGFSVEDRNFSPTRNDQSDSYQVAIGFHQSQNVGCRNVRVRKISAKCGTDFLMLQNPVASQVELYDVRVETLWDFNRIGKAANDVTSTGCFYIKLPRAGWLNFGNSGGAFIEGGNNKYILCTLQTGGKVNCVQLAGSPTLSLTQCPIHIADENLILVNVQPNSQGSVLNTWNTKLESKRVNLAGATWNQLG